MNVILFDHPDVKASLLPLTYTRPVARILVGIQTIEQKWGRYLGTPVSFFTEAYLSEKYPMKLTEENLLINGGICPNEDLVKAIKNLNPEQALVKGDLLIAGNFGASEAQRIGKEHFRNYNHVIQYTSELTLIDEVWKIFSNNRDQIIEDFKWITNHRKSASISDKHTIIYSPENVFIEEGVKVRAAIINAEEGPVYLGKNTQVQEGAIIKGPFALLENSHVNMGAKMREGTTIGPYCKVGGEVKNTVIFGFSNKGHEGFLGDSVLGEWCNLGADTNSSNLKNNYSEVKIWNYVEKGLKNTGLKFCGLVMGDHSKCSINTMFNTGTVVGVSANIFGAGFPEKFVPSFSWGGSKELETYQFSRAFEVVEKVYERRGRTIDHTERQILQHIFDVSSEYRN